MTVAVRLKDLKNDTASTPVKKTVRLSDLKKPVNQGATTQPPVSTGDQQQLSDQAQLEQQSRNNQAKITSSLKQLPFDTRQSPVTKQVEEYTNSPQGQFAAEEEEQREKARNLPVVGPVFGGLQVAGDKIEPVADLLRSFFIPGAGVANVAGAYGAAENTLGRVAPSLGKTLAGKVAQEAIKEAAVGIPLSAGQAFAQGETDLSEQAKQGLIGGVLGAGVGALGPLAKKGITRLKDLRTAKSIPAEAPIVMPKADPLRPQLQDEFTPGQSLAPEIAEDIVPSVSGRNGPVRLADLRTESKPPVNAEIPNVAPFSTNEQMALDYLRTNPTAGNNEIQRLFKIGYTQIQKVKDAAEAGATIIPKAELPEPVVKSPESVGTIPNERRLITTLRESGKLTDDVQRGVEATPSRAYQPITNKDTVDAATERIGRGVDEAEAFALGGKGKTNADQVATGFRLIQQFQDSGQTERAVTIAERLAERLTEAGQTVQAASIWNRLTPAGALVAAKRMVKAINQNLPKFAKEVEITPKIADDIAAAATTIQKAGASKTRSGEVLDILDRLKAKQTVTDADKQTVLDFIKDAETFVKPKLPRTPKAAKTPKEMSEPRTRDQVISFLEAQEKAAKERLRSKGIQVSSLPLDVYADYAYIGALKLAKGTIKFTDWSEQMVKDLGQTISPYLADIYEKAQETISSQVKRVTTSAVEAAGKAAQRIASVERKPNEQLQELTTLVKDAIDKSKNKSLTDADLTRIRELSKEIMDSAADPKLMSEGAKELQSVRALAKKLAGTETEKQIPGQSLREMQSLVREITQMSDEGLGKIKLAPLDKSPLEELSARLLEKPKPSQAEKVALSYLRKNEGKLAEADIELVRTVAKEVSELSGEAQNQANQDLQAILNGFERAGVGKKLSAAQYIFMLLNPLTQVKNVVGNEMLYRLERLNRTIATPIDWATSKLTGKDRQITFRSGPVAWKNFFAPTSDYIKGLKVGSKAGWRGVNPDGLSTAYDISGQAFRSKLNPLTYLEKTLGAVMKGFDYAAYTRATQQRLREMAHLDAVNKGIKGKQSVIDHIDRYMGNLDDNIAAVAKDYGKYVTLQDNTLLSKLLNNTKRGLNLASTLGATPNFGAGNLIIPFAKTPANLLMRAIDYSPAGFAKSILQAGTILFKKNTDLTRADVIQSLTRAILGTGIGGMGLWLADKGVLKGESASDRDVRELEKQAGISQYQLNASAVQRMIGAMVSGNMQDVDKAAKIQPGDTLYQYEWAQPSSMPLALGANIYQERTQANRDMVRKGQSENKFKQSVDVTTGALNTLFNSSVLEGLQRAFDFPPGEENKVKAFGLNLLKQVPSMAVPSIVGRINMLKDDAVRETYSPDFLDNLGNPAQSRVPGTAQSLPQRVDTLGKPQTRENSIIDVFLNPAQRTVYKPSKEAKLVIDLLAETGDEKVAPRSVAKYITGTDPLTRMSKKVDLTGEQYVKLQTIVGEETAKRLGRLNPNLSTERKVKAVIDILDEAGKVGREKLKKELGLR